MVTYTLYYVPSDETDPQTGETLESEPLPLHLAFGSYAEATAARSVLETLYGARRVEIDVASWPNTCAPGEGA